MERSEFIRRAVLEIGSGTGLSVVPAYTAVGKAVLEEVVGLHAPTSVLAARCLAAKVAVEIEDHLGYLGYRLDEAHGPAAVAAYPVAVNRAIAKAWRYANPPD